MEDLMALGLIVLVMLGVGAIFWRYPVQHWFEQRIPMLFSPGMARSLEFIALNRPLNHFGIHVLLFLGAFTLVGDITGTELTSVFRYSVAILAALFALTTARHNANQRAALPVT